jgi:hypothetical protein
VTHQRTAVEKEKLEAEAVAKHMWQSALADLAITRCEWDSEVKNKKTTGRTIDAAEKSHARSAHATGTLGLIRLADVVCVKTGVVNLEAGEVHSCSQDYVRFLHSVTLLWQARGDNDL